MAEHIERETVVSALRHLITPNKSSAQRELIRVAEIGVRRIPAADVAPVVKAKWEFSHTSSDGFAVVKCSNCWHEAFAMAIYVKEGHFCPNCGAKMEE